MDLFFVFPETLGVEVDSESREDVQAALLGTGT
jgi:hypothetical protein